MPPEQLDGGILTPATDVFAVGVLLIEAWSGSAPFRRKSLEACREALREAPPVPHSAGARRARRADWRWLQPVGAMAQHGQVRARRSPQTDRRTTRQKHRRGCV